MIVTTQNVTFFENVTEMDWSRNIYSGIKVATLDFTRSYGVSLIVFRDQESK